jgi:DNA polymerase III alpha subunit
MLDKFNRYECDEETGINLLYKGKSLKHVEFKESADVKLYNEKCNEFDIESLQILSENDFDRINTYLIPEHYKSLDVEEYVRKLVSDGDSDQIGRVEMELTEFKTRNLFPVLKVLIYIIDTMRKNNLVWGIGRGSSVASYVLYLIGIHKVDSLKYNLDIKEFLK